MGRLFPAISLHPILQLGDLPLQALYLYILGAQLVHDVLLHLLVPKLLGLLLFHCHLLILLEGIPSRPELGLQLGDLLLKLRNRHFVLLFVVVYLLRFLVNYLLTNILHLR